MIFFNNVRVVFRIVISINVKKKRFLRYFYFGHVLYVFQRFLFSKRFFSKKVGSVQSGKQINKKHFQNNSYEIDL